MEPKNVYVIGAQCTGKSTMVRDLEASLSTMPDMTGRKSPRIIREVAREVLKEHGFSRDDITLRPARALALQQHILKAQFEAETAAARGPDGPHWYVSDRSGLDPIAYTRVFVGDRPAQELLASPEWMELERRMKDAVVVLCETNLGWLDDDGVRLMPEDEHDWLRVDRAFRDLLEARGIRFIVIPRDVPGRPERVAMVVDALRGVMRNSQDGSS